MAFGIVTIVEGDFYARMAKALALSLNLHCPEIPKAVICSKKYIDQLNSYYSLCIPIEKQRGTVSGFEQKLHLDFYSPFDETLYLDCDSLAYKSLNFIPKLYSEQDIGYVGKKTTNGIWYNVSIEDLCRSFNLKYLIQAQGGFLFFRKRELCQKFFSLARNYHQQSLTLGVPEWSWRGKNIFSDEIAIGLSLSECGIEPIEDRGTTMRYPMGLRGRPILDVINSKCILESESSDYSNDNCIVEPAIFHFCTWHNNSIYTRERIKLDLYNEYPFLKPLISPLGLLIESVDKLRNRNY